MGSIALHTKIEHLLDVSKLMVLSSRLLPYTAAAGKGRDNGVLLTKPNIVEKQLQSWRRSFGKSGLCFSLAVFRELTGEVYARDRERNLASLPPGTQ
jgi:hypothetical protein